MKSNGIKNDGKINLSVITPVYNDFDNFYTTIVSLKSELTAGDQLIIVDSSDDKEIVPNIINSHKISCEINIIQQPPEGVYSAINEGIKVVARGWMQVLNSGDEILPGARMAIHQAIITNPSVEVHVFYQKAGMRSFEGYIFKPDARSLWPHQSIVLQSSIHGREGFYDVARKITSDQIFFARVRKKYVWKIHDFVLTFYDLCGMSSAVDIRISMERWSMWRELGQNPFVAFWRSWVKPYLRLSIGYIFGHQFMTMLKMKFSPWYSRQK